MFQDDKMIPLLTAIVVMIAIGAVVQRMDGISDYISEPAPTVTLVEDSVPVVAGKLRRIDVFANDLNVTADHRIGLQIAKRPECGQVFIQDDLIQYLADDSCAGRQTIFYTIEGLEPPVAGQVVAFVSSDGATPQPTPSATEQPKSPKVAQGRQPASSGQPGTQDLMVMVEDTPLGAPEPKRDAKNVANASRQPLADTETAAPSLVDVLTNGAADTADAAQPEIIAVEPNPPVPSQPQPADSSQPTVAVADGAADLSRGPSAESEVIDLTNVPKQPAAAVETLLGEKSEPLSTPEPQEDAVIALVQPNARVEQPSAAEDVVNAPADQELILAPVKHFQPVAPGARPISPRTGKIDSRSERTPVIAPAPQFADPAVDAVATDFMVAVIPLSDPKTAAPAPLGVRTVIDGRSPKLQQSQSRQSSQRVQVAALVPGRNVVGRDLGPALRGDPVDKDQPPPKDVLPAELHPIPKVRDTAALQAAQQAEQNVGHAGTTPRIKDESNPTQLAALPAASAPCVTPPATTIDVGRAAHSTISIVAPCHANTIAELTYSGLRFAIPLNGEGSGTITALGFEPNSAALLIFDNGEKIDFDLPFKGVKRVSRVALVWDMPVSLELNAFEFGAKIGDEAHVWSGNPRSFRDIRKAGGGYLMGYRAHSGIGQNVQIYTHYSRNGTKSGIVNLMIDFASRNRDLLDGTCGSGRYAAPQFLVIRSESGRKDRPVLRKLAPMACSDVPAEKGDKRLISGAVADLVISR